MEMKILKQYTLVLLLIIMVLSIPVTVCANATTSQQKYYIGEVINAGKNTGYSEQHTIDKSDLHYGWELGTFSISDFTRKIIDDEMTPVFLKNVGDKVTLSFKLHEDIALLNGDKHLSIADNTKAFDEYFGITETDFGYGTLIIRHTDYQNHMGEPIIYTDYLTSVKVDSDTEVELLEEGDYEVALNYKIKDNPREVFGVDILPSYSDYRIFFEFSVRNGNAMVFPFDALTGEELTNTSITENGFYLDLAKSRYLDIDVKKEVLQEGANGLTEDVRFNRPARDGEEYTDEGIYTFTVTNRYTEQETTKTIYVGTNDILKSHVTTGLSIAEIKKKVSAGATINSDGTINEPVIIETPVGDENITKDDKETLDKSETPNLEEETSQPDVTVIPAQDTLNDVTNELQNMNAVPIIVIFIGCVSIISFVFIKYRHKIGENKEQPTEENR